MEMMKKIRFSAFSLLLSFLIFTAVPLSYAAERNDKEINIDLKILFNPYGTERDGLVAGFINELDINAYDKVDLKKKGVVQSISQWFSVKDEDLGLTESVPTITITKFINHKAARSAFFEAQIPVNAIYKTKLKDFKNRAVCFSTVQGMMNDAGIITDEYYHSCNVQYKNIFFEAHFDLRDDTRLPKSKMAKAVRKFGKKFLGNFYQKLFSIRSVINNEEFF